jgi:hypothetical protein
MSGPSKATSGDRLCACRRHYCCRSLAGLRHVPLAAQDKGYTTCPWGWKRVGERSPQTEALIVSQGSKSGAKVTRLPATLLYI